MTRAAVTAVCPVDGSDLMIVARGRGYCQTCRRVFRLERRPERPVPVRRDPPPLGRPRVNPDAPGYPLVVEIDALTWGEEAG